MNDINGIKLLKFFMQLIMSSDKLGSIQQPVVSVDFDLCEGGETRRENVELSKDELEQLISSLEAANKVQTIILNIHSCVHILGC